MHAHLTRLLANVFDMKINDIHDLLTKDDIYKWDSLVHMELVTRIENEFNIQLSMEDMIAMDSVQSIITVLSKYEAINVAAESHA